MTAGDRFRTARAWTCLFAANLVCVLVLLVVDAAFDAGGAHGDIWAGAPLGLVGLWAVGLGVALSGADARDALFFGAGAVSVLQFIPCLHLASLGAATDLWSALDGPGRPGVVGWAVIVFAAGLPLFTAATGTAALWSAWRRSGADGDDGN